MESYLWMVVSILLFSE